MINFLELSTVASVNPRKPKGIDEHQTVSFLSMASVSEYGRILEQEVRKVEEVKSGYTYFERGDMLLAKITPCFENGKATLTSDLEYPIGFGSTEFHVIRPDLTKLDPNYLFHLIWSPRFRYLGKKVMKGAAGQKRVPADFLKEYKIPLPALEDQKRIAHLLGKVEGLITQRKQHLEQLDELLKSLFLDMFGDPVRNEKGWNRAPLGKAVKLQGGFAFKSKDLVSEGTTRLVKISNVHFEKLSWDEVAFVPDHFGDTYNQFALNEGDLLIALTRPVIKSLNVVKTATVQKKDLPCLLNQRVARFILDEKQLNKRFLLQYCYTQFFKNTIESLCPPGLQPNVSTKQIEGIPIFFPPIDSQKHFAKFAERVERLKLRFQKSLNDLENLYGVLSQKAFKGELDLSCVKLPNDPVFEVAEPAEVEKIGLALPEERVEGEFKLPESAKRWMYTTEGRNSQLGAWFDAYLEQLEVGQPVLLDTFLDLIQQKLHDDDAEEAPIVSIDEYDQAKCWLVKSIEDGRVEQVRGAGDLDEEQELGNKVVLKKV